MNEVSAFTAASIANPNLVDTTSAPNALGGAVAACAQGALQNSPPLSPSASLASLDSDLASLECLLTSPTSKEPCPRSSTPPSAQCKTDKPAIKPLPASVVQSQLAFFQDSIIDSRLAGLACTMELFNNKVRLGPDHHTLEALETALTVDLKAFEELKDSINAKCALVNQKIDDHGKKIKIRNLEIREINQRWSPNPAKGFGIRFRLNEIATLLEKFCIPKAGMLEPITALALSTLSSLYNSVTGVVKVDNPKKQPVLGKALLDDHPLSLQITPLLDSIVVLNEQVLITDSLLGDFPQATDFYFFQKHRLECIVKSFVTLSQDLGHLKSIKAQEKDPLTQLKIETVLAREASIKQFQEDIEKALVKRKELFTLFDAYAGREIFEKGNVLAANRILEKVLKIKEHMQTDKRHLIADPDQMQALYVFYNEIYSQLKREVEREEREKIMQVNALMVLNEKDRMQMKALELQKRFYEDFKVKIELNVKERETWIAEKKKKKMNLEASVAASVAALKADFKDGK